MHVLLLAFLSLLLALVLPIAAYLFHLTFIGPRTNPLRRLPGPDDYGIFKHHLGPVMDPNKSATTHQVLVKKYGRLVRIKGPLPWDDRLLVLDPVSISYILKNTSMYEKPWQSRRVISGLIGDGLFAVEGEVHKRQRRVMNPAFSVQNLRALVPLMFNKGHQLRDRWLSMIAESDSEGQDPRGTRLDVCQWVSRATFDIIGLAGFDYSFNAVQDDSNELFVAYHEMFEIALSQQVGGFRDLIGVYFPLLEPIIHSEKTRVIQRSHAVIQRLAGQLIQEKRQKLLEAEKDGSTYQAADLLTMLMKSNAAVDLPLEQRISDDDLLSNISTFLFAGSDSTSLTITWLLYLLAAAPAIQTRLRTELLTVAPPAPLETLTEDEMRSFYDVVVELPYFNNVIRETLRLVPPVHSTLRVPIHDDVIPTGSPVKLKGSNEETYSILVPKGTFVHVPIEAFNLDREVWGWDAWHFNPDRWDRLPEAVLSQPGLYSNTLTFSSGPRSCPGMRLSLMELKSLLFVLITNFVYSLPDEKIERVNVVLTRPYIKGQFDKGSQCPLYIKPFVADES